MKLNLNYKIERQEKIEARAIIIFFTKQCNMLEKLHNKSTRFSYTQDLCLIHRILKYYNIMYRQHHYKCIRF